MANQRSLHVNCSLELENQNDLVNCQRYLSLDIVCVLCSFNVSEVQMIFRAKQSECLADLHQNASSVVYIRHSYDENRKQ